MLYCKMDVLVGAVVGYRMRKGFRGARQWATSVRLKRWGVSLRRVNVIGFLRGLGRVREVAVLRVQRAVRLY